MTQYPPRPIQSDQTPIDHCDDLLPRHWSSSSSRFAQVIVVNLENDSYNYCHDSWYRMQHKEQWFQHIQLLPSDVDDVDEENKKIRRKKRNDDSSSWIKRRRNMVWEGETAATLPLVISSKLTKRKERLCDINEDLIDDWTTNLRRRWTSNSSRSILNFISEHFARVLPDDLKVVCSKMEEFSKEYCRIGDEELVIDVSIEEDQVGHRSMPW